MPFINISLSSKIGNGNKEALVKQVGKIIGNIPNKTEEQLMISINDNVFMSFAGKESSDIAYVDVRCFKKAPFEANKAFCEELSKILIEHFGIDKDRLYITVTEYETWGSKVTMKRVQ